MSADVKKAPDANRRYMVTMMATTAVYVLINVLAIVGVFDSIIGRPIAWGLAIAVAIPVIVQIWAILALIRGSDEFVRALIAKRFIVATGLTLALASIWGFGESYADASHIDAWLIVPVFWGCFGIVSPFIRSSR